MKFKIIQVLLFVITYNISIVGQSTEDFETETTGGTAFADNGQNFTISNGTGETTYDIEQVAGAGWNGSAPDNKFIDNSGGLPTTGDGSSFMISTTDGTDIFVNSLYIFISTRSLGTSTTTLTITGKKDGVTVFTITKNSGFSSPVTFSPNNGFTLIDFSTEGGSDNSSTALDELIFSTTGNGDYLALDALNWEGTPSCTNPDVLTVTVGSSTICPGGSTTLNWAGANLNDATAWHIYTTSCGSGSLTSQAGTSLVVSPGSTTTYYIRGEGGCVTPGSCGSVTVTVADAVNPTITCPGNQTGNVDGSCFFSLPDYTGLATASDNCTASPTITQSPAPGTNVGVGTTVVTLTATDGSSNTSNCTFNVVVSDATAPIAVCQNITVFLNGAGNASITSADIDGGSTDNCGSPTLSASQTSFTCANLGSNSVTLTATDGSSNTDNCVATVTVLDTTSPTAVCQNISVALDGSGNASIVASAIDNGSTDNCSVAGLSVSPAVFTCSDVGSNNITLTVTDVSGNTKTCTSVVTVTEVTPPTAVCQNISVALDGSGNASISASDLDGGSTDNCGAPTLSVTQTSFTCLDIGANNVTLTATDINSNTANCIAVVTVTDAISPTAVCQNVTTFLDGSGNATITAADLDGGSTDNCSVASLSASQTAFTCADLGANNVTLTVLDGSGNSDNCTAIVTVADTISPVITCPGNQLETPNASCQFVLPDYTGLASATDNCNATPTITQSPVAGTTISGTTTITLSAADGNGNTKTCTFDVQLNDATNPTAVCQNINAYLDGAGNVSITASDIDGGSTDNCSVITLSASQTSFTCADIGVNSVTLTTTDGNSNTDNCTATVTVWDTISPTAVCQNISVALDGSGNASITASTIDNGSVDNCSVAGLSVSPAVFTCSDVGANNVTLTVADASGNTNTCASVVTVTEVTPPTAVCQNISVALDGTGSATIIASDIDGGSTDNCGAPTLSVSQTSFTCADIGANNITLTATDVNSNTANCVAVVTVTDPVSPTAVCQNITTFLDDAGNTTITAGDLDGGSTDNCSIASLSASQTVFTCSDIGANSVTLTVIDGSGNSDNCTATVTVADTTSPVINCPGNQTENSNASCQFTLPDYTGLVTVTDNCSGSPVVTQSPVAGTIISGTTTITMTADDGNGNTSSCTFDIVLIDNTPPTLTCPGNQVGAVDATCMYTVPDYTGLVTASDNCGAPTVTQSPVAGSTVSQGTTTVTLTASDGTNITSCTFDLNVSGPSAVFTSSPASACVNDDVTFTDASINAVSWSWDFGDGNTSSSAQNPVHAYITSGSFDVTLDVTDAAGCTVSTTNAGAVVVNPPVAALNANPTVGCAIPHTVFFTDMSTLPDTWFWDFGDANTSTAQNPVHTYTAYGTFTVLLTVTDTIFGCQDTASVVIQVEDVTPPSMTCPGNQTENVNATCQVSLPDYTGMTTVTDLCDPSPTVTQSPVAGTSLSGAGTVQTVWIYAEDAAGNVDSCSFDVTLQDAIDPTIACPGNQTEYVDGSCVLALPDYTSLATVGDNCDASPVVTQSPIAGTTITGHGTVQNVVLTVTDASGNNTSCNFDVTVLDTISPTLACLSNQQVSFTASCDYMLLDYTTMATFADNCGAPVISQSPVAGTVIIDTTTITLTVDDGNGNSTSCTFDVEPSDDTAPSITCTGPQTEYLDAACSFSIPDYMSSAVVSDNCTTTPILTQSPTVGTVVSSDATIMVYATDDAGNVDSCSVALTLLDTISPVISCPIDQNVDFSASCDYTIIDFTGLATATDNCSGVTITQSPTVGTVITTTTTITLTATDGSGNTTNCAFDVTPADNTVPTVTCPSDQNEVVDGNCEYTIPDYTTMTSATDNCSGSITFTQSPVAGTVVGVSSQTITITADDGNGNTTDCTFTLTVTDNIAPVINCPADQTDSYDGNCAYTLPDYTTMATVFATDNCGTATITQSPVVGTLVTSNTTVTLTADDGNGNTTSCTFNLTLSDTTSPVVECPSDETIYLDGNCQVELPDYTLAGNIFDNCDPSLAITQSPAAGTLYEVAGVVEVTLTATDASGNVDSCSFIITLDADENSGCVDNLVVSDLISPNGDGKNDYWILHETSYIIGCQVMVYNRWGQKVFEAENYDNTWDGTYQGEPLPDGAYYYVIICDGEVQYKGDLSILRLKK